MALSGWNDPADDERHPHRAAEREHARAEFESRLRERRITIEGSESDEDLIAIVNAVEDFESRVSQLGGDTFVNTPESSEPEDERLVIPARRADEAAAAYASRVRQAAERLS